MLDIAKLFEQPDPTYSDQNYLEGKLIHCFDGFTKHLLSRIHGIFHDPLLVKSLYEVDLETLANPVTV